MPTNTGSESGARVPPDWALAQAMNGLDDNDTAGLVQRAWDLVRDYEDERHDEDDDPDQGGEA
ncbi:hypothetical protein [Terrabacter sp. BE26]|uniref:hypothetical protein n=1 Tax=Terrabacter sp. BE26 TaxID=2898152 RepID=UPI0035BE55A6